MSWQQASLTKWPHRVSNPRLPVTNHLRHLQNNFIVGNQGYIKHFIQYAVILQVLFRNEHFTVEHTNYVWLTILYDINVTPELNFFTSFDHYKYNDHHQTCCRHQMSESTKDSLKSKLHRVPISEFDPVGSYWKRKKWSCVLI